MTNYLNKAKKYYQVTKDFILEFITTRPRTTLAIWLFTIYLTWRIS